MASHTVLKLVCTTTHDLSIHSNPLSRQAMTVCLMSPVMISTYCIYTCRHRPLLSQRFPLPLARNQNGAYNAFRLLACNNWTYDLDLHRNITGLLYSLRLDLHITYEIHESFTFEKSFSKHFQTLTTVSWSDHRWHFTFTEKKIHMLNIIIHHVLFELFSPCLIHTTTIPLAFGGNKKLKVSHNQKIVLHWILCNCEIK